ncbi:MAG: hypothetical protein HYT12_00805 [Candidatus Liptonbacteria bacterium]|nr:hypothetical protein [Candidatus Liptonbacteria bacterium]
MKFKNRWFGMVIMIAFSVFFACGGGGGGSSDDGGSVNLPPADLAGNYTGSLQEDADGCQPFNAGRSVTLSLGQNGSQVTSVEMTLRDAQMSYRWSSLPDSPPGWVSGSDFGEVQAAYTGVPPNLAEKRCPRLEFAGTQTPDGTISGTYKSIGFCADWCASNIPQHGFFSFRRR